MPCGPICPASDALCIAGFKGYRPCRRPLSCGGAWQEVKCVYCAAATALKGAVESLNRKVSDRWVVMARASVNEADNEWLMICSWMLWTIFCPQLRNTRTAAGFEHMRSKTHAEKLPLTWPLESIKNNLLSAVPKHSNSSRIRAHASKTHAEKLPHVTFGIHKKQSFVRSSETLEQQQDSSTC